MRRVIDLVIPTFREERYLPKCLNSIKKQTLFDKINVIIADYNPLKKTETFEIAKSYGAQYIQVGKKGIAYARHTGISYGKAPIIMNFDGDAEFIENNTVEQLIKPIIEEKKVLTCCRNELDEVDIRDNITFKLGSLFYSARDLASEISLGYEPGLTLLRSAYDAVGGFIDTEYAEGMILDLKILAKYGLNKRKHLNNVAIKVSSRRVNKFMDKGYGVFLNYGEAYRGNENYKV